MHLRLENVSLDDCDLFYIIIRMYNFFFIGQLPAFDDMATISITSFTFILLCVPLPVCHTTSGK